MSRSPSSIFALLGILAALAAPAAAEEPIGTDLDFSKDGIIHEMDKTAWGTDPLVPSQASLFTAFSVAGYDFELVKWRLSDVRAALGGSIQESWSVGYHNTWLCYIAGSQRVWYLSDGNSSTLPGGRLSWIVQEPSNAASDAINGCTEQPLALPVASDTFPMVGATLAEINNRFGTSFAAGTERISFQSEPGSSDYRVFTIYFRLRDDVVDGVSINIWHGED